MKKAIFLLLVIISVFLIFLFLQDKKVYYLVLGDDISDSNEKYNYSDYLKGYLDNKNKLEVYVNAAKKDYKVTDLTSDINNNIKINDKTIKNALIKADILTLSLGYNDVIINLENNDVYKNNELINKYLLSLNNLFVLLRQYCKENIIFIGNYNIVSTKYDSNILYLNNMSKELCDKYNIYYIDITDIKNNTIEPLPTIEQHHIIFNKIRNIVDANVITK